MNLKSFRVKNFRRLKDVYIELEKETSIFVGANNSGKTSSAHILQIFLGSSKEKFSIYDFSANCWDDFNAIGKSGAQESGPQFPTISLDLWFDVQEEDVHRVIDLLPSLDWSDTPVGVRLEFSPREPEMLSANYQEAQKEARKGSDKDYQPWPTSLTDYLTKRLKEEYDIFYYVLDREQFDENFQQKEGYKPLKLGDDKERTGAKIIKSLMKVDFLHAQRYLSDSSAPGRSEDLTRRLNKFYERNLQKREDDFEALRTLKNSEVELDKHLAAVFEDTLKSLNTLGYPGFNNPHLLIKSALNPEYILTQSARVHYTLDDPKIPNQMELPDKYNGLGFKNLIYMVIELLDFHARWIDDEEARAPVHLVIIEEPEAHLHAQLQQIFIRQILKVLKKDGATESAFSTQLLITTHSPHIIYESGFVPIRYFRRSAESGKNKTSTVLNLSKFYNNAKTDPEKETRDFLQRYMKLTHCDLFFADAAILVEGNVERLLLPLMMEKLISKNEDVKYLQACYLSILEVGGAFAHRFKELIEFLGIKTLIITDLDSVKKDSKTSRFKACHTHESDAVTSNPTLKDWLPKIVKISDLVVANDTQKTQSADTNTPAVIYVSYQTKQEMKYGIHNEKFAGRTFEEAFALENLIWCQDKSRKLIDFQIEEKLEDLSPSAVYQKVHEIVRSDAFNKTNFALGLMTEEPLSWKIPAYIEEGLLWLNSQVRPSIEIPAPTEEIVEAAE